MILGGRASGGPLDGVRLDAPADWDGQMECCRAEGRYAWLPDETGRETWRWTDPTEHVARVFEQRERAYRRYRERYFYGGDQPSDQDI